MKQVDKIRQILTESGLISEAQESNTQFEQQADTERETFKKETDRTFKADRLSLEDILNNTGKRKRDYVRRIIKTINGMIDGKKDVDNLISVVKQGKGNYKKVND